MATSKQATARRIVEPEYSLQDAARRWRKVTSQPDDSVLQETVPYRPARQALATAAPTRRAVIPTRLATSGGVRLKLAALACAAVAGLFALYIVLSALFGFLQTTMDDVSYGRPRTTHFDAYFGHAGEQPGQPTHFIAMNLERRVMLIELPGGDTKNATTITGPYLFGDSEDLTPVKLSAEDVNGDGQADLLVTIKNEQIVYVNYPRVNAGASRLSGT